MNAKFLIAAVLIISGTCANAADDLSRRMEHLVTIGTRVESPALEHKGSLSWLDSDELELVGHTHIQQSLNRVPGVNLHHGSGQEYLPAVRSPVLTGAGACGGFLMAEDGIPLRASGFCNVNELFEAHTELAQRIEVLRGPGTAVHGSNALHGVVNVITLDSTHPGGFAGLEVGPYQFGRLKLSTGRGDDQSGLGLNLTLGHDGGFRDDSGYDQGKITARHRLQRGNTSVTSGLALSKLDQQTAGFIIGQDAYRDAAVARSNANPEAYRKAQSLRLWSRAELALDDGSRLITTPYLRYTDMEFLQHFLPGDPLEENGQRGLGIQTAWHRQQNARLDIIAGIDAEYTAGFLKQSQDAPTPGSAFLQETIPVGQHYDYEVDSTMVAPFMQLDWQVGARWQATLGARFEYLRYDYTNNMLAGRTREDGTTCGFGGCRYSRPPSGSNSFRNWSPKLALSYQLARSHMAYVSLSRGFRAPQATELYRLQREQRVADLQSERADSMEIGIKGDAAAWRYSMAAYWMKKEQVIFRDSDFFNVDDGKTDHQGIELEFRVDLSEQWDFAISGSYARHRYDYDQLFSGINIRDNDVDTAPRHFGSARLGWVFSDGRAELEWQHMGAYYTEPENLRRYGGHDLLHLRLSWNPATNWHIYVRLLNLTDEAYAERADFTGFSGPRYFPGMPRSLYAGLEWHW